MKAAYISSYRNLISVISLQMKHTTLLVLPEQLAINFRVVSPSQLGLEQTYTIYLFVWQRPQISTTPNKHQQMCASEDAVVSQKQSQH